MSEMISAQLVKTLREMTGAAMMECKKALVEASGDLDAAIEAMRIRGQAKAINKSSRIAAEGIVVLRQHENSGVLLEINCETDFVARDASFLAFAAQVADTAARHPEVTLESLLQTPLDSGETVETARQALIIKIGENVQIRRLSVVQARDFLGTYVHGSKIGVLLSVTGGTEALAKDLAMHVAAMKPMVLSPEQVPAEVVALERKIQVEKALDSDKPQDVIDKMIEGRIRKFLNEMSLAGQAFVKDPSVTVAQWLTQHAAAVTAFVRFEVGEGIEKKVDNFVEEVMAQVKSS